MQRQLQPFLRYGYDDKPMPARCHEKRAPLGEFDLPERYLRGLFATQKESGFVGRMMFRSRCSARATLTGSGGNAANAARCAAFPSSTTFSCLTTLEEFDQIALLNWRQIEIETGVVMVDHLQERRKTAVVEKAALRPRPEAAELRRNQHPRVQPPRPAVGLEGVNFSLGVFEADFLWRVRVEAGVGVKRRHVALRAFTAAVEDRLTTFRRCGVEAARRWRRRLQRELVVVERGQLRRDLVGVVAELEKAASDRRGKLGRIVEPLVVEVAVAVHLEVRDVGVPVGDVAEVARPSMEVLAEVAIGRRNPGRRRLAVRAEADGVDVDLRVVEAGAPAQEDLLERVDGRWVAGPEDLVGHRRQVGRERDDQAGVQILVRPAVQPLADPRGERVVDRRMAESAGDADRAERATRVEDALDADNRVQLQESERGRSTVEIDLSMPELRLELSREGIDVDLQAGDCEGRLRADTGADASEGGALDRLVQLEHAAPVVLVAESVEAEDLLALLEQPDQRLRAPLTRRVDRLRLAGAGLIVGIRQGERGQYRDKRRSRYARDRNNRHS
jgi:hypothetical protein